MIWDIKKSWNAVPAYIIGGGYSINFINIPSLKYKKTIGVNNAYKYNTAICWFGDVRWREWQLKHFPRRWRNYKGIKASCHDCFEKNSEVFYIRRTKDTGIEDREIGVANNGNSGGSAINVAYHLGANPIILLGFDMKRINNQPNFHTEHRAPRREDLYDFWMQAFRKIKSDADHLGIKIFNANPDSAMDIFPKITFEEAISKW